MLNVHHSDISPAGTSAATASCTPLKPLNKAHSTTDNNTHPTPCASARGLIPSEPPPTVVRSNAIPTASSTSSSSSNPQRMTSQVQTALLSNFMAGPHLRSLIRQPGHRDRTVNQPTAAPSDMPVDGDVARGAVHCADVPVTNDRGVSHVCVQPQPQPQPFISDNNDDAKELENLMQRCRRLVSSEHQGAVNTGVYEDPSPPEPSGTFELLKCALHLYSHTTASLLHIY